jgi:hypothetical protein
MWEDKPRKSDRIRRERLQAKRRAWAEEKILHETKATVSRRPRIGDILPEGAGLFLEADLAWCLVCETGTRHEARYFKKLRGKGTEYIAVVCTKCNAVVEVKGGKPRQCEGQR